MKKTRFQYDLAYSCFLFCGLTILAFSILSALPIPMGSGAAGYIGFFVAIPLFLALLVAMAAGIILSARLWKHWPLVILSGMSVLFIAEIFTEYGSTAFYNAFPIVYGIGVVSITGAWFLVLRKRKFPTMAKN